MPIAWHVLRLFEFLLPPEHRTVYQNLLVFVPPLSLDQRPAVAVFYMLLSRFMELNAVREFKTTY